MTTIDKSAGKPGAPSCSNGQQANMSDAAQLVFAELATGLDTLQRLMIRAIMSSNGDSDLSALLDGAYSKACHLGYIAERAEQAFGGAGVIGEADTWLLSPAFRERIATFESKLKAGDVQ
ncbi:MAG: hypothetical protein H6933_11920 [Burkholderiaceae bacterium]|nr:hypothetical protein [Rhodoferax sp.]MCP5285596.1 hypothetical protein [Burkholderiaceae bacterium]